MWWMAALIAAQPVAGSAVPGSREFDMQCMLVTQQAATEVTDKNLALMTQIAAMFFMGRVDVGLGQGQLAAAGEEAATSVKGKPLGPLLQACGDFMQQRGKVFEAVGAKLTQRETGRALR